MRPGSSRPFVWFWKARRVKIAGTHGNKVARLRRLRSIIGDDQSNLQVSVASGPQQKNSQILALRIFAQKLLCVSVEELFLFALRVDLAGLQLVDEIRVHFGDEAG